jgi:wobble nucleotide-excising tRNase
MISNIEIKNCASFSPEGVTIEDLKKVNFIYGANGSGKTTISNVIADISKYKESRIDWKNDREIQTFVYNRNFVDDNFSDNSSLKGVFTLGKDEKDTKDTIATKKTEIAKLQENIEINMKKIEGNEDSKKEKENQLESYCWNIYSKLKNDFKTAFKGSSQKKNFKDKCKLQVNNTSDLLELDKLKEKSKRIYDSSTETKEEVLKIDFKDIKEIESNSIWTTKIIGKKDVEIASMIEKLDNSDWVKQGRIYFKKNDGACPFCQQSAERLKSLLSEYFDETYLKQIKELKQQQSNYLSTTDNIVSQIETLIQSENTDIDNIRLKELLDLLTSKIDKNKLNISSKIKEPSSEIIIAELAEEQDLIDALIEKANDEIKLHNDTVKNITKEKNNLKNEIWRYVYEEIHLHYDDYKKENEIFNKAIDGLKKSTDNNTTKKDNLTEDITKLEHKNTGVKQTKTEINALLKRVGFTSFKLIEATEEKGSYQIVRQNGDRVERTLSEGEKTFITFLYFYHWLKGSFDKESITIDRVIVFDDPISSLDSDVLFIVSYLIRELINKIRKNSDNIKQIIILTHNVRPR